MAEVLADDGVDPAGDADLVHPALTLQDPGAQLLRGLGGDMDADEVDGGLVEGAGGVAVGVPVDDAAGGGLRGRPVRTGDPGDLQGAGVDPGGVVVGAGELDRTVDADLGAQGVELGGGGGAAREVGHGPAAAGEPGVGLSTVLQCSTDESEGLVRVRGAGEVEGERLDPGEDRMGVGVDEAGGDETAGRVDDAVGLGAFTGTHSGEDAVGDGEGVSVQHLMSVEDGGVDDGEAVAGDVHGISSSVGGGGPWIVAHVTNDVRFKTPYVVPPWNGIPETVN